VSAEITQPLSLLATSNRELIIFVVDSLVYLNFELSYVSFVEVEKVKMVKV